MRSRRAAMFAPMVLSALLLSAPADAHRIGSRDGERGQVAGLRAEPAMAIIPETAVYYARDLEMDLYRFGTGWYTIQNGQWYRARSWRGLFVATRADRVPAEVRSVPAGYRINWYGTNDAFRSG